MSNTPEQNETNSFSTNQLLLSGLIPLIGIAGLVGYLVWAEGGLSKLSGPPVEKLHIQRITLPSQQTIRVHVVNEGPEPVHIAQVLVDEAYWNVEQLADGPVKLSPRESEVLEIPYHWVKGNAHEITLISSSGVTFSEEIPVAVETPTFSMSLFWQFGLVGLYVGVLPVLLGVLWYPLLTRLPAAVYHFVLALTVGLLAYLAVGTWLDAMEFAEELPGFWQGTSLTVLVSLLVFGGLVATGTSLRSGSEETPPLQIAYLIAFGIGLHNLGEGLAIGSAYASGEAALGTFLVIGFTLHNLTEGIGIAAPVVRKQPALHHFVWLVLLGGAPAILGTWIGGFAFTPVLGVVFLSVGIGAILQVIWEVGKLIQRETSEMQMPALNGTVLSGFFFGALIMYVTGILTKM